VWFTRFQLCPPGIARPACEPGILSNSEQLVNVDTPAFIYDEAQIAEDTSRVRAAVHDDSTKLLFALKSFSMVGGVELIAEQVDGFAASSLFEAMLGRRILGDRGSVHLTTPGLRSDELPELMQLCDYISCNSLSQWQRFRDQLQGRVSCGLRVNPELSFVADSRYDPCRPGSKLGVPLSRLCRVLQEAPEQLAGIRGLHIHSNCDADDFSQLLQTVTHLEQHLGPLLARMEWLNLGGGYLFDQPRHLDALAKVKARLTTVYGLQVFIEPGAAMVRRAGRLLSSVVDLFDTAEGRVAVLDTSVNHMPEVFEYQFQPDVAGQLPAGGHVYSLVGSSCLAGDVFGRYRFSEPLEVGTRLLFEEMGAYSMVKANMFNGINLPAVYARTPSGELVLQRRYDFEEFLTRCGARIDAGI
jgi:carboxynorspermidine decarboxylase